MFLTKEKLECYELEKASSLRKFPLLEFPFYYKNFEVYTTATQI